MSMQRKKVVWNSGEKQQSNQLRMMPHIANRELAKEHAAKLVPGSLWQTAVPLRKDDSYPEHFFIQPPFPYLTQTTNRSFYQQTGIYLHTLALYLGEVRVDELTGVGREVSVIRHCFLINGTRYLTRDVNDFSPVV